METPIDPRSMLALVDALAVNVAKLRPGQANVPKESPNVDGR